MLFTECNNGDTQVVVHVDQSQHIRAWQLIVEVINKMHANILVCSHHGAGSWSGGNNNNNGNRNNNNR